MGERKSEYARGLYKSLMRAQGNRRILRDKIEFSGFVETGLCLDTALFGI